MAAMAARMVAWAELASESAAARKGGGAGAEGEVMLPSSMLGGAEQSNPWGRAVRWAQTKAQALSRAAACHQACRRPPRPPAFRAAILLCVPASFLSYIEPAGKRLSLSNLAETLTWHAAPYCRCSCLHA